MARLVELQRYATIPRSVTTPTPTATATAERGPHEPQPFSGAVQSTTRSRHAPVGRRGAAVGKTLVSSGMIDRVAASLGRRLAARCRWASSGPCSASTMATLCFGRARRAPGAPACCGATAMVWTTWIGMGSLPHLLASEMLAETGADPGQRYAALTAHLRARRTTCGSTRRRSRRRRGRLARLAPEAVKAAMLACEPTWAMRNRCPPTTSRSAGSRW